MQEMAYFREARLRAGSNVKTLRLAAGLTQESLAQRLGVGWRHLQKIEAGEINLTLRTLCRCADVFCVDVSRMLDTPNTEEANGTS